MPKLGEKALAPLATLVGPIAFYIGLLVVLVAASVPPTKELYVVLGVVGAVVGALNITAKETGLFLFASIAFIVAAIGMANLINMAIPNAWAQYPTVLRLATNLVILIGTAAMIISLRAIYELAKSR